LQSQSSNANQRSATVMANECHIVTDPVLAETWDVPDHAD